MKKDVLLFLLFSFLIFQAMQANQPERQVLYMLGKNEILHYSEYTASLKFDGQKFACIVEDTTNKELSFIYDGEKKITADYYIMCHYLSFDGFDKCVISYGNHRIGAKSGDGQYYKVEDKLYGPYEGLYDISYANSHFDPAWNEVHHFSFTRMGNKFTHKSDGSIKVKSLARSPYCVFSAGTSLGGGIDEEEPSFQSPDEKHVAHFSLSDIHKVYVDGMLYVIPSPSESQYYTCCVFDDGSCLYYDCSCQYDKFGKIMVGGNCNAFFLSKGNVRKLSSTEIFNFKTQSIVQLPDAKETAGWFEYLGYYFWSSTWDYESIKGGNYIIPDKEEKHYFISNVEYNFVMVDEYHLGKECALSAWYDPNENAFLWIAWEENELVSYRYKL